MASTIFHHWLDRIRALPRRRRLAVYGAGVAGAVVVVFVLGVLVGRGVGLPNGLEARAHRLAAGNVALQNDNQSLHAQVQTANTTIAALQKTMAGHDAEMQSLKQQQAFYAKLIGIDGDRSGLGVHSIALSPVQHTGAWNFTVILVNTAENAGSARGTLTLAIEGVRAGKLATLDWATLAGRESDAGLPYAFKFFQQLQGTFALPAAFVPNRVLVTLQPDKGAAVTRSVDWSGALAGKHGLTLGTP